MHPEQAEFEKRIDENPLDSNTHAVYADWLDDHGQHDEAAFRRAMGDWTQRGPDDHGKRGPKSFRDYKRTPNVGFGSGYSIHPSNLPEWAADHIESSNEPQPDIPRMAHAVGNRFYWGTYRGMEEGLRRAFMEWSNRPRRSSRKPLSRKKFFRH